MSITSESGMKTGTSTKNYNGLTEDTYYTKVPTLDNM